MLFDELMDEVNRRASSPTELLAIVEYVDCLQRESDGILWTQMYDFICRYVTTKRRYKYFINHWLNSNDWDDTKYKKTCVLFEQYIETYRDEIWKIEQQLTPETAMCWKREIGAKISECRFRDLQHSYFPAFPTYA